MPIKRQPVIMDPADHSLTLDELAKFIETASAAGVHGSEHVRATTTILGGWLRQVSAYPAKESSGE